MLNKLLIKNIALIDSVEIDFSDGLNVLSGETGAGKSVIIESLNFVLGAKADKSLIRSGEAECYVRAEFELLQESPIFNLYDEFDFDKEDVLIISRKFTTEGKSSIKINGNTATVGMLKKFTAYLIDVHGQSEHFSLLKSSNQLQLIDDFAGEEVTNIKNILREKYKAYKDVVKDLNQLGGDEGQRLIKIDILNYQINEIESANILDGEEENLLFQRDKLRYQEKILSALSATKSAIDDEGGISDVLSNLSRLYSSISSLGNEYSQLHERISGVFSELDDISSVARDMIDEMDSFEYNADQIEARLDKIKTIKNKYGNTYQEVLLFLENAKNEKAMYENFAEHAEKLTNEKCKYEKEIYSHYVELSNKRRCFAQKFASNILDELTELGMPKAKFFVEFNELISAEDCLFDSSNGIDEIEFMFSANNGQPLKSMSQVISGGEMSRFMLAIKAQTAKYNCISTFIFDEIDAGISGVVAKVVANKFAKISQNKQLIAISHLPQISAMADKNLLIVKRETDENTTTEVMSLNFEQKINEVVRLVGGDINSENAILHAKELITQANKYKENIKSI